MVGERRVKIVICDDILQEGQNTKSMIQRYYESRQLSLPEIVLVQNSEQVRAAWPMDILFLDIQLHEELGIALAAEINRISPYTMVIFVSSYPFYVTAAYTVKAAQFFVKPLQWEVFEQEFARVLRRCENNRQQFTRRIDGETIILRKDDIVYIKAQKPILTIFFVDGDYKEYRGKISEEEAFFANTCIVRCHRSYLVNLAHAYGFRADKIIVRYVDDSTEEIPVGDNWHKTVQEAFLQYLNQQ